MTIDKFKILLTELFEKKNKTISNNIIKQGYKLYNYIHTANEHTLFPVVQNDRLRMSGSGPYQLVKHSTEQEEYKIKVAFQGDNFEVQNIGDGKGAGWNARLEELFQLGLAKVATIFTISHRLPSGEGYDYVTHMSFYLIKPNKI